MTARQATAYGRHRVRFAPRVLSAFFGMFIATGAESKEGAHNRRRVDQPRLTALILWTFTNRGGAQERWIEAGLSGRSGRPSPVTGDAAMPDPGYVPDVPVPMARGVVVTTEELAAAMGTRTALSGLSSGWVA